MQRLPLLPALGQVWMRTLLVLLSLHGIIILEPLFSIGHRLVASFYMFMHDSMTHSNLIFPILILPCLFGNVCCLCFYCTGISTCRMRCSVELLRCKRMSRPVPDLLPSFHFSVRFANQF